MAQRYSNPQGWDPRYWGFFDAFNEGLFYESHDILEDLWLERRGEEESDFYKALIQTAGCFVHLSKNKRRPAVALFDISAGYFSKYPAVYKGIQRDEVVSIGIKWKELTLTSPQDDFLLRNRPLPKLAFPDQKLCESL